LISYAGNYLIKDVLTEVKQEIYSIIKDQEQYQQLIIEFIKHSMLAISTNSDTNAGLIVELNQNDYTNLLSQWPVIIKQLNCDNNIKLSDQFHHMSGGIIVYNQKRSIRIDNTFEGRIERLSESIHQLVSEEFFSELSHESDKIHGR